MTDLKQAIQAIRNAGRDGPLFENEILTGYSGKKLMGALQRLARLYAGDGQCYLEIGVFQGLTLLSVAKSLESGTAYGIDNFAFFDPGNKNLSIVQERIQKLGVENAVLINQDYEDALAELAAHLGGKKVGLYFVDGPHDYRSQLLCLLLIRPFLAERCAIVIDDSNYRHVRQANADFLQAFPEFKLLFEAYTPAHPQNLKGAELEAARNGWWNGVNILVRDPEQTLSTNLPKTRRSRKIFENSHLVYAAQYPAEAPEALRIIRTWKNFQWHKTLILLLKSLFSKPNLKGKYRSMNTFSEGLPEERFGEGRF